MLDLKELDESSKFLIQCGIWALYRLKNGTFYLKTDKINYILNQDGLVINVADSDLQIQDVLEAIINIKLDKRHSDLFIKS